MSPGTRFYYCGRVSAAFAFVLAGSLLAAAATAKPRLLAELEVERDYKGPVQRIALDRSGTAWMATPRVLYKWRSGKPQVVDDATGTDSQLALAPAGGIYAWLVHDKVPGGLFTVQLMQIPKKRIADLRLPNSPFGFGGLYLGGAGQLIVTVTPLDSPEGLGGEFLYTFWSDKGRMLSSVTLEGRRSGVVDVAGNALLLLGESDAIAFARNGTQLWKLAGKFRRGALAADGKVALLNPAEKRAIHEVHVFRNGTVTPIKMSSPVYDLALAADGSDGAVAIDNGELFFVAPKSCELNACKLRAIPPLPVSGAFDITAVRFLDADQVAIGVIERVDASPRATFPAGDIFVVTLKGRVMFTTPVKVEQPATWTPLIDVTYDARLFAAHTPHRALFVRLDP